MHATVKLFAGLRARAGTDRLELELADGARVADLRAALTERLGECGPFVLAVDRVYAADDVAVPPGAELAAVPPVSGGQEPVITDGPLSLDALIEAVRDPRAGAIVTFSGTTREVDALDYEAYSEMAGPLLEQIVAEARERHGACRAAARHRTGRVALGEASVIVAVSAPHRPEAFDCAREIIDELKARLPVWKREDGAWKGENLPAPDPGGGSADR